ncbi:MAG: hypothetical protein JRL30_28480 [Deltaproteobacteria bacterium]|nr:hypothetical protein [Deltaproteobacteria bacterium]
MSIKLKESLKIALGGHKVVTFDRGIHKDLPQEAIDVAKELGICEFIEDKETKVKAVEEIKGGDLKSKPKAKSKKAKPEEKGDDK